MVNLMSLEGKRILVTGASEGIGRSTAILASNLGAKVVLVARNKEKLQRTTKELKGDGHSWYSFDLTIIKGISQLVSAIVKEQGKFNGLVHCAGISGLRPLKMTDYNFLNDMFLINFNCFVELVRCFSKKENYCSGMSIVAISSISAIRGYKAKTAYSASKSALDGAIRSMAKELGEKKIRVNSIIAGSVKTKMFEQYVVKTGKDEKEYELQDYLLGIAEPSDIANPVVYLLSDASRIITGIGLVADSGASL